MSYFRLTVLFVYALFIVGMGNVMAAGSGGFRNESPDAGAFGKGSAFVGEANTPAAVYYNPAGINQIKNFQISLGAAAIAPRGSYEDTTGQKTQLRNRQFLVPHVYAVLPVNQKLALGLGSSSYWGLGTEWAADSFSRYVATKTDLINTDSMLVASYQVTDQWTLAVGADNDDTKANKNAKLNNLISADGNKQLKAKSNAWGYRLATMFKINEQNQVGLMYRSPIHHKYEGKVYLDGIDTTVYGPGGIAGLPGGAFPNSSYETKVTEKYVLPQSITMGYSFKPTQKWTFNLDLEWMNWSKQKDELISFPDETDAGRLIFLNTGNPINRHWHSSFSESIGGEYAATEKLRLRAGYYHHGQVVPQGTFDPSIPADTAHGATLGFGYDFTQHLTLDVGYAAQFYQTRKINNDVGSLVGANVSGKYREFVNDGVATLTYKF